MKGNTIELSDSDNQRLNAYYFNDLQGDFYAGRYYRRRDLEEESAIVYGDGDDKGLFSYMIKDFFTARRVLEIGCAMGYLLRQLVAFGFDAWGIDFSQYCIERVPKEIKERVLHADLLSLPFPSGGFDMVIGLDILEHLPPSLLPDSLASIHRVLKPGGIYFGVIPAYGENRFGPTAFDYHHRQSWIEDAEAGRPFRDIPLDVDGKPHMGHLIHATVAWWEQQFSRAGFQRLGSIERAIHQMYDADLDRGRWGIFIFQKEYCRFHAILGRISGYIDRPYLHDQPIRSQGFFNWEFWQDGGWTRWTGKTATEVLRKQGRSVSIPFLVNHPDCSENNPVLVSFSLNQQPPAVFPITRRGWHEAKLLWLPRHSPVGILHISVSPTFIPAQISDSDDRRELGIALRPIVQNIS